MTIHLALVDGRMRDETSTSHLSSDHLAAFLDGRLTGAERERAVRHFAGCGECRSELTELRDVLASARPRSRGWFVAAVAAAGLLAVVTIPQLTSNATRGSSAERVRAEEGTRLPAGPGVIDVVSPADQALVSADGVQMSWRSVGVGATYTVTVQDSSSNEVWRRSGLLDTSVTVPDSVRMRAGLYFWSVDARLADGSSAKTGARTFIIR
jgi:anti-sigma factor RsiW